MVTGANGFLGRRIARRLDQAGIDIVTVGRPDTSLPSTEFDELLAQSAPDTMVHCAGPASVAGSLADPVRDLEGSVVVLVAILDRLRRMSPPPRLLFLSSAAVYGQPSSLPINEDAELAPLSPYGFHRVACELVLREFSELYGVPAAIMRIFSAYGEGLRRQILWDICKKALETHKIELSGTGLESRDFIHAADVGDATLSILRGAAFETEAYNVASGRETRILDLASLLAAELGVSDDAVSFSGASRPGDPARWCADISRLRELGFKPSVTLEAGARAYADSTRLLLERNPSRTLS